MYAKITQDLIWEPNDFTESRKGVVICQFHKDVPDNLLDVRLLDDDREHYYTAVADDDALEFLYEWAQRDAGVTILQTKDKDGKWEDCIG